MDKQEKLRRSRLAGNIDMDKTHGDKDPSVTRNIRLPAPLLEAIKVKASAERRSINQWIVNALQDATEGKCYPNR